MASGSATFTFLRISACSACPIISCRAHDRSMRGECLGAVILLPSHTLGGYAWAFEGVFLARTAAGTAGVVLLGRSGTGRMVG